MSGAWKRFELPPAAHVPERHWLGEVLERRGPVPVTLRGDGVQIAALASAVLDCDEVELARLTAATPTRAAGAHARRIAALMQRLYVDGGTACRMRAHGATHGELSVELLVDQDALDELLAVARAGGLQVVETGLPLAAAPATGVRRPGAVASDAACDLDEDAVIVAIIDHGIGIANERFRRERTKTRVEYFLDMQAWPGNGSFDDPLRCVSDVRGRTWTRAGIDALLQACNGDDEAVYRNMGLLDARPHQDPPLRYALTHGTHVLDIAAGYDLRDRRQRATAAKRPILAVQLPSEVVADSSGASMEWPLRHALRWLEDHAKLLARRMGHARGLPLVLNFSFGVFAGPHDGHGRIERLLGEFLQRYAPAPCRVVLPSGNSFQARAFAQMKAGAVGAIQDAPSWRVQPDDRTASFLHIWLPASKARKQQIEVTLIPPRNAPAQPRASRLDRMLDWVIDGHTHARLYHRRERRAHELHRECVTVALRPTASDGTTRLLCPAGGWTVRIKNLCLPPAATIDLRIQRDDTIGVRRVAGRQSYFDDARYRRFDKNSGRPVNDIGTDAGPVQRAGTFNAYATGGETIVVAGYRASDGSAAVYSGAGPTSPGGKLPALAAVCEDSPSHRGVLAAGTYSGTCRAMNGTSVAAPAVARRLADDLARGITAPGGPDAVKRWFDPPLPADARFGFGALPAATPPPHRRRRER